jgi:hypothetical protein
MCLDKVINTAADGYELARAPQTGLDNLFPELSGIVPRAGAFSSPTYVGMWHYINFAGTGPNDYDDRRGLDYDHAGPIEEQGQLDGVIQLAIDLADFHINFDQAKGPKQYEIRGANDGHEDSVHRSFAKWQGPSAAHLQFSPLDNFAFWGWKNFRAAPSRMTNSSWLRWPLHALGDATVPMHVTTTSAWGHRAYEDAIEWEHSWNEIRYLNCAPEYLGICEQQCFLDPNDPTKKCPEKTGTTNNSRNQFAQARKILQHAFLWDRTIQGWRSANPTARATDIPVRDLVTDVAGDTFSIVLPTGEVLDNTWPWCDDCSMQYWHGDLSTNRGMDFYRTTDSLNHTRDLVERSVGSVVAFLLNTADGIPAPSCSTTTCGTGAACCSGRTCAAGNCCANQGTSCQKNADCCNSLVCRAGTCVTAASNTCQPSSHLCEGGASVCCADPDSHAAASCGPSPNGIQVCCLAEGARCDTPSDCCSGHCTGDGRCGRLPLGYTCTADAQCAGQELCWLNGDPVSGGQRGLCCNPSTVPAEGACDSDDDCCIGKCKLVALPDDFACHCADTGESCRRDKDCCGGSCVNSVCVSATPTCAPDQTACGNSCCSHGLKCCGVDPDGTGSCADPCEPR